MHLQPYSNWYHRETIAIIGGGGLPGDVPEKALCLKSMPGIWCVCSMDAVISYMCLHVCM